MEEIEQADSDRVSTQTIPRRGFFKLVSGLAAGAIASEISKKTGNVLATKEIDKPSALWGKLVNSELSNDITRSAFFFAGPPNPDSLLQNLHPNIEWRDDSIDEIFNNLKNTGINSIDLSWWGYNDEFKKYSPTLCTDKVIEQVFDECEKRKMLVSPVLEVSPEFEFWKDYPYDTAKLEDRIEYFVAKYGSKDNWQKMYDRKGESRHVIKLIETIHGAKIDPVVFAQGFDRVAKNIFEKTGAKVGFVIDPTPLPVGGSHEGPDPGTLKHTESLLAVNPYNLFSDGVTENERIMNAEKTLAFWHDSGIPVIASIISGFDDTHFRTPGQKYGYNEEWYSKIAELARKYHTAGIRLDNWNAVTEGSTFASTEEHGTKGNDFAKALLLEKTFNPVSKMYSYHLGSVAKD
ncbi:MAG: hypothetical protein Q7T54_02130 [Candidatus Levybacteria bacterium]|nr:hypothetical protein [Candidatus Levybacteria bacterium]